jgi:hypothetical protein
MTPKEYLAAERLAAEARETLLCSSARFTRSISAAQSGWQAGYNQC